MKCKNSMVAKTAEFLKKIAVNSSNSTSLWGFHQPKEPECLKKISKQK